MGTGLLRRLEALPQEWEVPLAQAGVALVASCPRFKGSRLVPKRSGNRFTRASKQREWQPPSPRLERFQVLSTIASNCRARLAPMK
jgi:hypothetical protein